MDTSGINHMKGIIESLLLISDKPLMLDQIKDVLEGVSPQEIREMIMALKKEYEDRNSGIVLVEIAGGYQMLTHPHYAMYIRKFYQTKHKERLTKPSLETLAIIAYKQPVCRQDIELIRGVNSDGVTDNLLEKNLVKIVGRKEVPGRPYLYGTTKEFLEYFGLRSLSDLPKLEDFSSLEPGSSEEILIDQPVSTLTASSPDTAKDPETPVASDSTIVAESPLSETPAETIVSSESISESSQESGHEPQESSEKN